MEKTEIANWARQLDRAATELHEISRITETAQELSIPDAYRIQDELIALRLSRGERIVGLKMGLTSKAKMRQMNVDSPIYGVLTDRMQLEEGATASIRGFIHPKIEPEVAFILGKDLHGKVTMEQALAACEGVCAALEIIDSRYKNFNFTLPDVVADNCSSSAFVLGRMIRRPTEVDLGNLGMILEIDGKPAQFGSSAAIYGHPAASLAELCAMLAERGQGLKAGTIVLAGAATAAVALAPGMRVNGSVQGLGQVAVQFQ